MPVVSADLLVRDFRRAREFSGPLGSVRSWFDPIGTTERAVDGVSFGLEAGEMVAYLGANGAGKSTTMKMLTGVLVPTSGNATVCGLIPWKARKENALNVGAVFGQRSQLWYDLPLRDSFTVIAKLYGIPTRDFAQRLDEFEALLDLAPFLSKPVRSLSLGQRMRGDFVAAMLHSPPVLFLDEPTVGLDVVAKDRIRQFIRKQNEESGTTVLLTTHDIADVEQLCNRAIIIDNGRVLFDGQLDLLRKEYAPLRTIELTLPTGATSPQVDGAEVISVEDREGAVVVVMQFDPARLKAPDIINAVGRQASIIDFKLGQADLESIVKQIYVGSS